MNDSSLLANRREYYIDLRVLFVVVDEEYALIGLSTLNECYGYLLYDPKREYHRIPRGSHLYRKYSVLLKGNCAFSPIIAPLGYAKLICLAEW